MSQHIIIVLSFSKADMCINPLSMTGTCVEFIANKVLKNLHESWYPA